MRAARFHGEPTERPCPVCRGGLILLRYVYSDELGQFSGLLRTADEVVVVASYVVGDAILRRPSRRHHAVEDDYGY